MGNKENGRIGSGRKAFEGLGRTASGSGPVVVRM